jgi:hypothetical protein
MSYSLNPLPSSACAKRAFQEEGGSLLPALLLVFGLCHLVSAAPLVGSPADPGGLPAAITAAYNTGSKTIVISPGRYVLPAGSDRASLTVRNMHDVEIDAKNVDLSMIDLKDCVVFENCQNVVFKGATVHYSHPLTSQAKILDFGHGASGNYYDVQVDAGYPLDDFSSAYIVDPSTRHFKPGNWDMSAKLIVPYATPGQERIYWNGDYGLPPQWNVAAGDYVVCRGAGNTMLKDEHCTRCTFEDLTFYWGGVFGFFDIGDATANRFIHDTITYGPMPPGATNLPLLSQSADGLHSPDASIGPDIEKCLFEGNCDDGFAVHGYYERVLRSNGTALTTAAPGQTQFTVGGPIRIQQDRTGFYADAIVTAIRPNTVSRGQDADHVYDLTLDQKLSVPDGAMATNPNRCGQGYKIIGNTIRNNRARGMLLKADNGLVEYNVVDGSTIAGIVVSPEAPSEAGYSHHVALIGNAVRHTGYATTGAWNGYAGAITIYGNGSIGNQDISVKNNTFESVYGPNLEVRYAKGVVIDGNRFLHTHQVACDNGKGPGIDPGAVVWIGDSSDVAVSNNWARDVGPFETSLLAVAPSATHVTGLSDGLRLSKAK